MLVAILRDLWVLMAELATLPENRAQARARRDRRDAGDGRPARARSIDALDERFEPPTEFVVPGGNVTSAWLDLARTVVRRAERHSLPAAAPPSLVVPVPQPVVGPAVDDGALAGRPATARRCGCATSATRGRLHGHDGHHDAHRHALRRSTRPRPSPAPATSPWPSPARVPATADADRRAGRRQGCRAAAARPRPGVADRVGVRRQGRPDARRAAAGRRCRRRRRRR